MPTSRRWTTGSPGLLRFAAGRNVSPEGLGKGFEEGFVIDLADARARDAYLEHPAHRSIGGRLVAAAQGGVDGIMVFDFELQG